MAIDPNTQYTISGDQLDDLAGYVKDATEMPSTLLGTAAPTSSTVGNVGQTYLDKTTNKLYVCTAKSNNYYTWNLARVGSNIIMTDTDPGEGSVLADDTYKAYYGGSPLFMDYSTLEQDTGATWIDGKIIYKKTFSFTTDSSSVQTQVTHGISNLGVVVRYEGSLQGQGNYGQQPIPRVVADNGTGYNIGVGDITATRFSLLVGTSVTKGTQAYVTLYYTKSS